MSYYCTFQLQGNKEKYGSVKTSETCWAKLIIFKTFKHLAYRRIITLKEVGKCFYF